jgi:hypothetical protein
VAVNKSKPTLKVKISDDFVVDLAQKYWFIEVENYFWLRYATKHFRNVKFQDWMLYQLDPIRKYVNVKVLTRRKPRNKLPFVCVAGWYDTALDAKKRKAISVIVYRHGWPDFARVRDREHFLNYMIKTLVHELNHLKQSRKKNFKFHHWYGDYLEDPAEIDCFALNSAQSLVARYGVERAKAYAVKFKIRDSHCYEFSDYVQLKNENVKKRFIKKVLRYISIYAAYQNQFGDAALYSYRINKQTRHTRRQIKNQQSSL